MSEKKVAWIPADPADILSDLWESEQKKPEAQQHFSLQGRSWCIPVTPDKIFEMYQAGKLITAAAAAGSAPKQRKPKAEKIDYATATDEQIRDALGKRGRKPEDLLAEAKKRKIQK